MFEKGWTNEIRASVLKPKHHILFIPPSLCFFSQNGQPQQTEDSSMNLFKSNVRILIYQKYSTQNIELPGGCVLSTFVTQIEFLHRGICNFKSWPTRLSGEKLLFSWIFIHLVKTGCGARILKRSGISFIIPQLFLVLWQFQNTFVFDWHFLQLHLT